MAFVEYSPHVAIACALDVLIKEDADQLLGCLTTLVDILRVPFGIPLQLFVLRGGARATRHRRRQVARLLLPGGGGARSSGSLGWRSRTSKETRARRVQVLVRELLDQTVGAIVRAVTHAGLVGGLRGLQVLAIMRLAVGSLSLVRIGHEITTLSIGTVLGVHIILGTLVLVDRLGEGGGGSGIGAVVGRRRIETTIVVPEIQVESVVVVGIHDGKLSSPTTKRGLGKAGGVESEWMIELGGDGDGKE